MGRIPLTTTLLIAVNVVIFILVVFVQPGSFFSADGLTILKWGGNFNPYTLQGQSWRLIVSLFLHFNVIHLLVNMQSLFHLGQVLEQQIGIWKFVVVYILCGIAGGLASLYWNVFVVSAGASGAIFGLYGFVTVQAFISNIKKRRQLMVVLGNFLIFAFINIAVSKVLNVDIAAHLGGLAFGVIAGWLEFAFRRWKTALKPLSFKISLGVSFLLMGVVYFSLPQVQLQYFRMFQKMLEAEKQTSLKMQESRTNESLLKELQKLQEIWDSTLVSMESLPALPEELDSDLWILKEYVKFRKADIAYRILGIERESYIYYDSVEYINNKLQELPPITYQLKMEEVSQFTDTTEQTPLGMTKAYYDSSWRETVENKAVYYRIGSKDSLGRWSGYVVDYYLSGRVQMKGTYEKDLRNGVFLYYSPKLTYEAAGRFENEFKVGKWEYFHDNGQLAREVNHRDKDYVLNVWDSVGNPVVINGEGEVREYYQNGKLFSKGTYRDGLKEGTWFGYHEDGSPYFEEYYNEGYMEYGRSINEQGEKFVYDHSSRYPNPEGGYEKFEKYIKSEQIYPDEARINKVSGKVTLGFTVGLDGSVYDVIFIQNIGHGCGEEAKRLLLNGPKWVPGRLHGHDPYVSQGVVDVYFNVHEKI